MDDFLIFDGISKSFGNHKVLDNVSLTIKKGEIFSLLGPSGCGKTTLLRICAGLEEPDSGRIILNGEDITNLSPNKRAVNTVFQNYALFPHLTVFENIAFGLRIAGLKESVIKEEVYKYLELIQLTDHANKRPDKLSGGQKQRVAIARALINKPKVLLLDEPLAALDLKLRQRMLVDLDNIHDEVGITFLYVTHDQSEAMSLSDTIAVMNEGVVEQVGTPTEIYEAPRTSFVAAFIGDTNFFEGDVVAVNEPYSTLHIDGFTDVIVYNDKKIKKGDRVYLSIRPEKFTITIDKPKLSERYNIVKGKVEEIIYMGYHTKYWVRVNDFLVETKRLHDRYMLDEKMITWGDEVWLSWHADYCYMLEQYNLEDEALLTLPDEEIMAEIENSEEGEE
ncbi:MAG TPA: ABC transporter ATP-binding protein [Spirochaetota bacterium]|jgi:spermidine/putrescine transport system ATP-binding protein|nr:ABC transporter ATP-binding protein [Spirochaetota bacterium]HOV08125.1 ABC transporter ATP-binding protein [Spirochaetota bacterium]